MAKDCGHASFQIPPNRVLPSPLPGFDIVDAANPELAALRSGLHSIVPPALAQFFLSSHIFERRAVGTAGMARPAAA